MRKEIYQGIVDTLKARVEEIKHFDLYNQNVAFLTESEIFDMPAVFVEFEPINYQKSNIKEAHFNVRLHIVTEAYHPSADSSQYKEEALRVLDFLEEINTALEGVMLTRKCTPFVHVSSITNHNHSEIREDVEVFQMRCYASK